MHPQRPPPSGPTSGFRPQLATTVQLGLFGVLLLFALAIWLSMPILPASSVSPAGAGWAAAAEHCFTC